MSNIIYNGERLLQMVRYSDELLDEIKSKNDIVDIVSQYVVLKRFSAISRPMTVR